MALFDVNESTCRKLGIDMLSNLKEIIELVNKIDSQDGNLKAALGEDYGSIARSVRIMKEELESASKELNVIIDDMNEYMAKVSKVRIELWSK